MKTNTVKNSLILNTFLKTAVILFAGILTGLLLMVLVYFLPVTEQTGNVVSSMETLSTEGWYPVLPLVDSYTEWNPDISVGGVLDNYTDGIMISIASQDPEGRFVYQAMKAENDIIEGGYSYYWHGYVTILRPLLMLFDYMEIRILNMTMQMLLVLALFTIIYKKKGTKWALLSATPYALLMPMSLAYSLQFSWVFYVATIGAILLVRFEDYWRKNNRIYLLFLAIGMATSYFDLLTYPLLTWGLPVLWWIILDKEEGGEKHRFKDIILAGLFWILGYGGMWAGKWLVAQIILHENIIGAAWDEVMLRAGMLEESAGNSTSRFQTIINNWDYYNNVQALALFGAWLLFILFCAIKKKGKINTGKSLSFVLIATSSLVWYVVLHDHTIIHTYFTYRIYVVTITALLAMFVEAFECKEQLDGQRKSIWIRWCIIAVSIVLSVGFALRSEESYWFHNGGAVSRQIMLEEGQTVVQNFLPQYGRVDSLNLGIGAEGELKGDFYIEIYQGEELLSEQTIPVEDVADSGFYTIPVNIKVEKNAICSICISVAGIENTNVYISTTTEGDFTLPEFLPIQLDGTNHSMQLIGGITYIGLPEKTYVLLMFYTAFACIGVACMCGAKIKNFLNINKKNGQTMIQ